MSDLGEIGSPLPSYPTLPSPPSSDQHDESDLVSLADPTSNASTSIPPPSLTTSLGLLGDYDFPLSWQQQHQQMKPSPNIHSHGNTFNSPTATDSSLLASDLDGLTSTNSASMPIYATVNKQTAINPHLRTSSGSPFSNVPASGVQSSPMWTEPTRPSQESVDTLKVRVKYFEKLCSKLSQEKNDMEEEFGRQRKSFMNQMGQTDAELSRYRHTIDKYAKEVQELSKQVLARDEELQNVTIAAGITEATIRERFDVDRVKYEEEIASLTKIVSGKVVFFFCLYM